MQVEFLNSFSKDIDRINLKSVKSKLSLIIRQIESETNLNNIPNLKKLVGQNTITQYKIV